MLQCLDHQESAALKWERVSLLPQLSWLCSSEQCPTPLRSWSSGRGCSSMLTSQMPGVGTHCHPSEQQQLDTSVGGYNLSLPHCQVLFPPLIPEAAPIILSGCWQQDRHVRLRKPKNVACCSSTLPHSCKKHRGRLACHW